MSVSSSLTTVFQICKSDFPLFAVLELVTTSVNQPSLGLTLSKWLYYCLLIASLEQELPCQDYSLAIASLAYLDSWHKNAHLRGAPLVFLFGDAIISWGCLWSFTSSVTGRVQPQNEKVLLPVIRYPKKRKGSIYPNLHLFFSFPTPAFATVRHWRKPGSCWETLGIQLPQHPPASSTRHGTGFFSRKMWWGWKGKTWKANNKKCHILTYCQGSMLARSFLNSYWVFPSAMRCLEIVEIFGARFEAKRNWIMWPQSSEVVMHFRLQVFGVTWVTWGVEHWKPDSRQMRQIWLCRIWQMLTRSNSPMSWMLHPKPWIIWEMTIRRCRGRGAKLCNVGMSRDWTTIKKLFFFLE